MSKQIILLILWVFLAASPAPAQTAPGKGGRRPMPVEALTVYTPPDLAPGEVYSVALFPRGSLGGKSLADWVLDAATDDPIPPARRSAPPK